MRAWHGDHHEALNWPLTRLFHGWPLIGMSMLPSVVVGSRVAGVLGDGVDHGVPVVGVQLVAATGDADQPGSGDHLQELLPVRDRVDRIGRAMNDEQRWLELGEPALPWLPTPPLEVGQRRIAARPVVIPLVERPGRIRRERVRGPREQARFGERVRDDLLAVGPLDVLGRRQVLP